MKILFLIPVLLSLQDEPTVAEWIERLRSDSIEERETAMTQLKALGKAALKELERATRDPDTDLAGRAAFLLRVIQLTEGLTSELRRVMPGVEERLAGKSEEDWTAVFLEATSGRYPTLKEQDLEPLVDRALRGGRDIRETVNVIRVVRDRKLKSAFPGVAALLKHGSDEVRAAAAHALGVLGARDRIPEIAALLADESYFAAHAAGKALLSMRAVNMASIVIPFLKDSKPVTRQVAIELLRELESVAAVTELLGLLKDPHVSVRKAAILAVGDLEIRESLPELRELLKAPEFTVECLQAIGMMRAAEALPDLTSLLRSPETLIRMHAAKALGAIGTPESIPLLEPLLKDPDGKVSLAAATALCETGSRAGVSFLLERRAYWPLNALRRRDTWAKIRDKRISVAYSGPQEGLLKEFAGRFELSCDLSAVPDPRSTTCGVHFSRMPGTDMVDFFRFVMTSEIILEEKTMRCIPRERAGELWNEWWEGEQKKTK